MSKTEPEDASIKIKPFLFHSRRDFLEGEGLGGPQTLVENPFSHAAVLGMHVRSRRPATAVVHNDGISDSEVISENSVIVEALHDNNGILQVRCDGREAFILSEDFRESGRPLSFVR